MNGTYLHSILTRVAAFGPAVFSADVRCFCERVNCKHLWRDRKMKKTDWASIMGPISLGAVMFSTYVGPGFASGTQTVSYFLTKGWVGVFIGLFAVGALALVLNLLLFEAFRVYQPRHFRECYDRVYRNKILNFVICNLKDIITILTVIVSVAAQISGAATIFENLFGLPNQTGRVVFAIIILLLCIFGAKVLNATGSIMTIAILAVTVYIGAVAIPKLWPATMAFVNSRVGMQEYGYSTFGGWYAMIGFANMFISGQTACATTSRGILVDRKTVIIGSLTNVFLCTFSTMVYTVIFAGVMPEVTKEAIPTLFVLQKAVGASRNTQLIYAVLAIAAMISTGVSLIFSMAARYEGVLGRLWKNSSPRSRKVTVAVLFLVVCLYGSSFGILSLVRYGFGSLTKFGFPITSVPLLFFIPYQIWRDRKDGKINADGFFIDADLSAVYKVRKEKKTA